MTELQLYKFINNNCIEVHNNTPKAEVIAFIPFSLLEDLTNMAENYFMDDVEEVYLKYDYVCIDLCDLAEYYGIELDNVLEKESG